MLVCFFAFLCSAKNAKNGLGGIWTLKYRKLTYLDRAIRHEGSGENVYYSQEILFILNEKVLKCIKMYLKVLTNLLHDVIM